MPCISVVQKANAAYAPSYVPVVVITGATSGIGQAMTELLARYLRGRVHIVLVGRNREAAERIIASLPKTGSDTTYEFVTCDMTLMKNVHALAKDLLERMPKINYLVHSAGVFSFKGREETEEGIDRKLASRYYSRWTLTNDLLPLLRKAKEAGEAASVLSILGAGKGPQIDLNDLGLKKSWGGFKAMMQSLSYNDLMVAEFAAREPDIAFSHIFPGNVDTPGLGPSEDSSLLVKTAFGVMRPLIWLASTKQEVCAEYMLYTLLSAEKGMYRRNSSADDIGMKSFPGTKEAQKILWEHTVEETTVKTKESPAAS
ncbi:NAD(P)-binding protein [Pholiota conissans]|uniref:NAD(P)-binding protein n=1 Tax=Pholiota conissans TaxID=109636 RepID=A0A9P6D2F7_9AGAR|nr:NAD(P)-binding protein [Pholiota conissans]